MNESPTRQAGRGGSAVLERLASSPEATGMPAQAQMLSEVERQQRIDRAIDVPASSESLTIALLFWAMWVLIILRASLEGSVDWDVAGPIAIPLVPVTIWAYLRKSGRDLEIQKTRAAAMSWPTRQPFPVSGYENWLACDRPLVDIDFRVPVDRSLFEKAVTAVDAAIEVEFVGDLRVRLGVPPASSTIGKRSVRHGNVALLQRVFAELVLPLHNDIGVERVEMGGLVETRVANG